MKKIKVLHLITDLGKGGAERFLIDLCQEILKRGDLDLKIGVLYDNNQYKSDTIGFPIEVLNYQTFKLLGKNQCERYSEILDSFRPDIVHAHRFLAEFITSHDLRRNIRYVCHGHDNMIQFTPLTPSDLLKKYRVLHWVERQVLRWKKYNNHRTYFISNSLHTDNFYRKVLPSAMERDVKLVPIGFSFKKFYRPEKKILPLDNEELRLINVGSFQTKKNQIFIIDIAKELLSRGIKFRIDLLGDGENRRLIEERIEKYNLQQNVYLQGNVNNVEDWLSNSHIYLHTAFYEPFGLVFLEAMASGLPCVSLDGKGNKMIIEGGKNGFIIDSQDVNVFAEKIIHLYQNKEAYYNMSEYAKAFASNYSIEKKAGVMIEFYKEIVHGPK